MNPINASIIISVSLKKEKRQSTLDIKFKTGVVNKYFLKGNFVVVLMKKMFCSLKFKNHSYWMAIYFFLENNISFLINYLEILFYSSQFLLDGRYVQEPLNTSRMGTSSMFDQDTSFFSSSVSFAGFGSYLWSFSTCWVVLINVFSINFQKCLVG